MNNETQMTPSASTERAKAIALLDFVLILEAYAKTEDGILGEGTQFAQDMRTIAAHIKAAAIQRGDGQSGLYDQVGSVQPVITDSAGAVVQPAQIQDGATYNLRVHVPPAAKPNETSGATPVTDAVAKQIGRLGGMYKGGEMNAAAFCHAVQLEIDKLGSLERELADVRKSAGAEAWRLGTHLLNGGPSIRTSCETVASWEGDATAFAQQIVEAHNAAKSTPGVDESIDGRLGRIVIEATALARAATKLTAKPDADGARGGKEGV